MKEHLAGALSLLVVLGTASSAQAGEAVLAHVELAVGEVSLVAAGSRRTLRTGDALQRGALLVTGPRSRARLRLVDGSLLALGEETRLRLTAGLTGASPSPRRVELLLGRLWLRITSAAEFLLGVPAGTISVGGTTFVVEVPLQGGTTVTVLDGRVVLRTSRGEVTIPAGFRSQAGSGQPPGAPRRAPPVAFDGLLSATGAPAAASLSPLELRRALIDRLGLSPSEARFVTSGQGLGPSLSTPSGPLGATGSSAESLLKLPLSLDPTAIPVRVRGRIEFRP